MRRDGGLRETQGHSESHSSAVWSSAVVMELDGEMKMVLRQ